MNLQKARTIMNEAARLVELTATFQASYGKNYKLDGTTSQDAWTIYDHIMDAQSIIANLLDPVALAEAKPPYGEWWNRCDVMDVSVAQHVIAEIAHLIACVAYEETRTSEGKATMSHAVCTSQRTIAGMLHPRSYEIVSQPEMMPEAV